MRKAEATSELDRLIAELDAHIIAARKLDIPVTTLLLMMARLELQTERHDIDGAELNALCAAVERRPAGEGEAQRHPARSLARERNLWVIRRG